MGGLAMTACPGGAANGGGGSGSGGGGEGAGGKKVTFKHGARHLEGSGLSQAKVENAIAADVQASTKRSEFNRRVLGESRCGWPDRNL